MKSVLQNLQNGPCRVREISENERQQFSNYSHLQRYFPALDLFKSSDTFIPQTNLELPTKYRVGTWIKADEENPKIWKTVRIDSDSTVEPVETDTFVKTVHLLNPIDLIKQKYACPEHPLLPQSEKTWKNTLLKLHSHNNQAYVDAVANFVLSRFRELDLTPHCVLFYGATTGISKAYQYNISSEFDTYRQCRWFWRGLKSHGGQIVVQKNDDDEISNFDEIAKDITTCPFDENDSDSEDEVELEPISGVEVSDVESIKSINFDNIEEKADNVKDIFEINSKAAHLRSSLKKGEESEESIESIESLEDESCESSEEDDSEYDEDEEDSDDTMELDIDISLELPNMPIILIQQEAQEGVLDELMDEDEIDGHERGTQGWEARWVAWIFQVVAALTFLQSSICFTHNDLHSNNILWRKTDKRFLHYKTKDGTVWRVPTFGKIFSIIDFGRSIFRLGNHLWISDDHWPEQDAGDQYNFGPFFDHTKPKIQPNPSFDLSRLAVSLLDGLWDDVPPTKKGRGVSTLSVEGKWKMLETNSPLFNLLWSWTVTDSQETIYEDKDGNEKYEGFDLYIRIAHDVHNAIPKQQLHKPIFQQFKWKQKVPQEETIYSLGM